MTKSQIGKSLIVYFLLIPIFMSFSLTYGIINYSVIFIILGFLYLTFDLKKPINYNYFIVFLVYYFINVIILRNILYPSEYETNFYSLWIFPLSALILFIIIANSRGRVSVFFMRILIVFGIINVSVALIQVAFGFPLFTRQQVVLEQMSDAESRNYFLIFFSNIFYKMPGMGFLEGQNGFGSLMVLIIPISYYYWKVFNKKILFMVVVFFVIGLLLSFSRGAVLGMLVSFGILYMGFPKKNKWVISILIALFFGIIIYSFYNQIANYIYTSQHLTARESRWIIVVPYALKHPLKLIFGYGAFYFKDIMFPIFNLKSNLHNSFLQILVEEGVVGFSLFMLGIRKVIIIYKRNKTILNLIIISSLFGFYFTQLFDQAFFGFNGIISFGLLGLFFKVNNEKINYVKNI